MEGIREQTRSCERVDMDGAVLSDGMVTSCLQAWLISRAVTDYLSCYEVGCFGPHKRQNFPQFDASTSSARRVVRLVSFLLVSHFPVLLNSLT